LNRGEPATGGGITSYGGKRKIKIRWGGKHKKKNSFKKAEIKNTTKREINQLALKKKKKNRGRREKEKR